MSDVTVQQTTGSVTVNFGVAGNVAGASALTTIDVLTKVSATGTLGMATGLTHTTATGAVVAIGSGGITSRQAATQDAVRLLGRAGGTTSLLASITSAALTASRTATLPDADLIFAGQNIDNAFSTAQTIVAATGLTARPASGQDGLRIQGRAAGTLGYNLTLTTVGVLSADATVYLPTVNGATVLATSSTPAAGHIPFSVGTTYAATLSTDLNFDVGTQTLRVGTISGSINTVLLATAGTGGAGTARVRLGTSVREWELKAGASPYGFSIDYVGTDAPLANILSFTKAGAAAFVGAVTVSNTTDATTTSDGSVRLSGGLSVAAAKSIIAGGKILSVGATYGVGYGTGAGGTVTQGTGRTTGVTLDKVCGGITLFSTAGSTTPQSFTVTNSTVAATDAIVLSQKSGTDKYVLLVTAVAAGSFQITAYTTGGTTSEAPVINFAVIKAVQA